MKCFYHPNRDAVGQCSQCQKGICSECARDVGGATICPNDFRAGALKELTFARRRSVGAWVFTAIVGTLYALSAAASSFTPSGSGSQSLGPAGLLLVPVAYFGSWSLYWGWGPTWRTFRRVFAGWGCFGSCVFILIVAAVIFEFLFLTALVVGAFTGIQRYLADRRVIQLGTALLEGPQGYPASSYPVAGPQQTVVAPQPTAPTMASPQPFPQPSLLSEPVASQRSSPSTPRRVLPPLVVQPAIWLSIATLILGTAAGIALVHFYFQPSQNPQTVVMTVTQVATQVATSTAVPTPTAHPTATTRPRPPATAVPTATTRVTYKRLNASSNVEWQDTGMYIFAGDIVSIQYVSGLWTIFKGYDPYTDGSGQSGRPETCRLMPSANMGSLIGRVGAGAPFAVGDGTTIVSSDAGHLQLTIDDCPGGFADNDGSLTVDVSIL